MLDCPPNESEWAHFRELPPQPTVRPSGILLARQTVHNFPTRKTSSERSRSEGSRSQPLFIAGRTPKERFVFLFFSRDRGSRTRTLCARAEDQGHTQGQNRDGDGADTSGHPFTQTRWM